MSAKAPEFHLKIADSAQEVAAAQRLRYAVFVDELGADGPDMDHTLSLEADRFDAQADHLLLIDKTQPFNDGVVGTYRLLSGCKALETGGFYSASEFDLSPLIESDRQLLELGRSCVHSDYRGGTAMFELWAGLGDYVLSRGIDVLFGVASFHGTDLETLGAPLSLLHHAHIAPEPLRVRALGPTALSMNVLPEDKISRKSAMLAIPSLIKAYLRLGGVVGEGAWVDHAFNTTDVCMILDVKNMSDRQRALYDKGRLDA